MSNLSIVLAENPTPLNLCEIEMVGAAKKYHMPIGVLYAVGMTETGNKGSLQPYAMNVDGKPVFSSSKEEAIQKFNVYKRQGSKLIDVGCMQLNHFYHGEKFSSLDEMMSPTQNVAYAAQFLDQLYQREGSWTMAVARYHAGPNNNPAQKRYVCTVIRNLISSGFGEWTDESKDYCRLSSGQHKLRKRYSKKE